MTPNPPTGAQSDAEANKAIVRQWMQAVVNDGNVDALDELADPHYTYHGPGMDLLGVPEMKAFLRYLWASFPDMKATVDHMVAEGDLVATHWTLTATHRMEFMGIPVGGAHLHLPFMVVSRLAHGRVVEDWELCDMAEMMRQLEGALTAANV